MFTLGQVVEYQGRLFRYVQVVTAAGADGVVFVWSSVTAYSVIGCNRGGITKAVAGVGVGLITINYYGFILIRGRHANVISNTSTAGTPQVAKATNDTCTDTAAATSPPFGIALEATAATTAGKCAVEVCI